REVHEIFSVFLIGRFIELADSLHEDFLILFFVTVGHYNFHEFADGGSFRAGRGGSRGQDRLAHFIEQADDVRGEGQGFCRRRAISATSQEGLGTHYGSAEKIGRASCREKV